MANMPRFGLVIRPANSIRSAEGDLGLGVTFDQTVSGLSKILAISRTSSTVESNKWQGVSADKKIKLEVYGTPTNVNEANIAVTVSLEPDQKLSPTAHLAMANLLKNIFPEWKDIDEWVDRSVAAINLDPTASRTKLVRKVTTELSASGPRSLKLSIRPSTKPTYFEVN